MVTVYGHPISDRECCGEVMAVRYEGPFDNRPFMSVNGKDYDLFCEECGKHTYQVSVIV